MRKTLALLACLLALATLFVSCTAEQTGDLATVRLSIDSERSRTVSPDGNDKVNEVKKYVFCFTSSNSDEYTFDFNKNDTGVYIMSGIKPGKYTLTATALNAEEKIVSTATIPELKLSRGSNTYSVSFSALDSSKTGTAAISIKWTPSEYTSSITLEGSLYQLDGTGVKLNFPSSDEGVVSPDNTTNLPIGSYYLEIKGKMGNKVMFGVSDVILITPEKTTSVTYDFTNSSAVSSVRVDDTLITPLEGTLSIAETGIYGEVTMNLAISSVLPESIYKNKKVNISWYMEDYNIGSTSVDYNPSGTTASVTTGAFFGPATYTAIFHLEGHNESLGSASIKVNYDAASSTITTI